MREIKFMAWHKELKVMRQVLSLELEPEESTRQAKILVWDHPCARTAYIKARVARWIFKDCELLQFTVLKDKNGKEIYDGDILSDQEIAEQDEEENFLWEVIWNDQIAGWSLKIVGGNQILEIEYFPSKEFEVVGNIYQNPELLEAKK